MTKADYVVDAIILSDMRSYFQYRKYKEPSAIEALLWMISEMGEMCELILEREGPSQETLILDEMFQLGVKAERLLRHGSGEWVRNNPGAPKKEDIAAEAGDVLMMFYKFADKMSILPYHSMVEKFRGKGWARNTVPEDHG